MNFQHPERLLVLWFLPVLGLILVWVWRSLERRWQLFAKQRAQASWSSQISAGRETFKGLLLCLSFAAVSIALASPRWGYEWLEQERAGADILVAIDLSRSMLADDIKPSRLERAKHELLDLLGMLKGDRLGIVAFAGTSFVQCPLTTDYDAMRMFIEVLDPDLIPLQGTAIGDALSLSAKTLQESQSGKSTELAVILITDGENQDDLLPAAMQQLQDGGIKVFPIGVGAGEGAPIPDGQGQHRRDRSGNLILTKLDEPTLTEIAEKTGGWYVRSTAGDLDLDEIYQRIEGDGETVTSSRRKSWNLQYQWVVLVAFLMLLLEAMLRNGRFLSTVSSRRWLHLARRVPPSSLGLWVLFAAVGDDAIASPKQAREDFSKGNFKQAEQGFLEAEIDEPSSAEPAYNRAVSQYKQRDFENAEKGFKKAAELAAPGSSLRESALFNQATTQAMRRQYEDAIKSYEQLLRDYPKNQKVRDNLEAVRKLQEQKPPEQDSQQDQKDSDGGEQDQKEEQQKQNQDGQQKEQQTDSKQEKSEESESPDQSKEADAKSASEENQKQQEEASEQKAKGSEEQDEDKSEQPQASPQDDQTEQTTENSEQGADQKNESQPVETPSTEDAEKAAATDEQDSAENWEKRISEIEAERVLDQVRDHYKEYMYRGRQENRGKRRDDGKPDW